MIPLERKPKGQVQGIQYTGKNLADVLVCGFFPLSVSVNVDLGNMSVEYQAKDSTRADRLFVGDWLVNDMGFWQRMNDARFKATYVQPTS